MNIRAKKFFYTTPTTVLIQTETSHVLAHSPATLIGTLLIHVIIKSANHIAALQYKHQASEWRKMIIRNQGMVDGTRWIGLIICWSGILSLIGKVQQKKTSSEQSFCKWKYLAECLWQEV